MVSEYRGDLRVRARSTLDGTGVTACASSWNFLLVVQFLRSSTIVTLR
jgi:hypothetical protein